MKQNNRRYTKKQILGLILLIFCFWVFLIGIYWSIAKDIVDGFILSGAGAIGSGVLNKWLILIDPNNQ